MKKPEPEPEDSVDFEPGFLAELDANEEDEVDYSPAFLERLDAEGVKRLLEEEKEMLNKIKNEEEEDG